MSKKQSKKEVEEAPKAPQAPPKMPFFKMFRYADGHDKFMIFLGIIGSIINGTVMPVFSIVFGELMNDLNNPDPDEAADEVIKTGVYFLYLAAIVFVAGFCEFGVMDISAERQAARMRVEFLKRTLAQEPAWFDKNPTSALTTRIFADSDSVKVALGAKFGQIIHFSAMFVFGFSVGIYKGWDLAWVLLLVTPVVIVTATFSGKSMVAAGMSAAVSYVGAGGVATETLSQARTVNSLGIEKSQCKLYTDKLEVVRAKTVASHKAMGLGLGLIHGVMFTEYCIGLWRGSYLIAEEVINSATDKPWNGGDVMMAPVTATPAGAGLSLDRLVNKKAILAYFPLHNEPFKSDVSRQWINYCAVPWKQPLDEVKSYFGEKIGLYFAWLGMYTKWLLWPALVGLVVGTHQFVSGDGMVDELLLFAIFMGLWSTFFLEYWKRQQSVISMEWGMTGFEARESCRPEFESNPEVEMVASPVSGQEIFYFSPHKRKLRMSVGVTLICTLLVCVISAIVSIFWLRALLIRKEEDGSIPAGSGGFMAAVMNAVQIQIMNMIYGGVAKKLTDWENHETATEYEDALIAKTFLFQFINSYFSLFYIAFLKNNFEIFGETQSCKPNSSGEADCINEIRLQLATIFLTRLIIGNVMEIGMPMIKHRINKWKESRGAGEGGEGAAAAEDVKESVAEKQFLLEHYTTFDDWQEMIIQYGYVTLFAVAFPYAPLAAFISNYVEIRIDALKLTTSCRRPKVQSAEDIGTWYNILNIMGTIAVLSNLAAVLFSPKYSFYGLEFSPLAKVVVFLLLEHAVLGLKAICAGVIEDVPHDVQLQLQRQEFLVEKLILELPDEDDEFANVTEIPVPTVIHPYDPALDEEEK